MPGVALETYSRNELIEDEAFAVIQQAMRISHDEARAMLDELSASLLKRTVNGLAFQMRSYGEYLGAEELENAPVERVNELAFPEPNTPNDSWLSAVSIWSNLIRRCERISSAGILSGRFPLLPQRFPTMKKRGSWRVH